MNDNEFAELMGALKKYLDSPKMFVQNLPRLMEINAAAEMAKKLFPEAKICFKDDPIQMGALILSIEDYDLTIREMDVFSEMISKANNFEIYAVNEETVCLSILFNNALIRL